jgi:hypothetical protein
LTPLPRCREWGFILDGFVFDGHPQIEQNPYVPSFEYKANLLAIPMLANQGKQAALTIYRPVPNLLLLVCSELFRTSHYDESTAVRGLW